jgi:hypothetical protein
LIEVRGLYREEGWPAVKVDMPDFSSVSGLESETRFWMGRGEASRTIP